MDEEKFKEKYMQLQMLDQQIKSSKQQVQALENQLSELKVILLALDEFKKLEKGNVILAPFATGIYLKAQLVDNEQLMVNVGANITVKKNIEETKSLINQQITEVAKVQEKMVADVKEMVSQAKKIQKILQSQMEENK